MLVPAELDGDTFTVIPAQLIECRPQVESRAAIPGMGARTPRRNHRAEREQW